MNRYRVTFYFICSQCLAANRGDEVCSAKGRPGASSQVYRTVRCQSCSAPLLSGHHFTSSTVEINKAFHVDYQFICAKCKKENRGEKTLWAGEAASARGRAVETMICTKCHAKVRGSYEIGTTVTEVTQS